MGSDGQNCPQLELVSDQGSGRGVGMWGWLRAWASTFCSQDAPTSSTPIKTTSWHPPYPPTAPQTLTYSDLGLNGLGKGGHQTQIFKFHQFLSKYEGDQDLLPFSNSQKKMLSLGLP